MESDGITFEEETYWIAHVRGGEWPRLRREGFLVLYPSVDDYVFLEASKKNKKKLNRQTELGIYFLKDKKGVLSTVKKAEIDRTPSGS